MDTIFQHPPILENHRALLKPLAEEDFEALCEVGVEPSLWELSPNKTQTKEDMRRYLITALEQRISGQALPFTIIDKAVNKVAGCTRFGSISPEHKRLEIGWTWLGTQFQKTGLNRACKYELLQYAFKKLGMNRVELKTNVLNIKSREAMRKIGATEEGIFRRHMISETGQVRDTVYFSIIQEEWEEIRKRVFSEYHLSN